MVKKRKGKKDPEDFAYRTSVKRINKYSADGYPEDRKSQFDKDIDMVNDYLEYDLKKLKKKKRK